jgi:hypothetical protein
VADLKEKFLAGESFVDFLKRPKKYADFWGAMYKRAAIPPDLLARATNIDGQWHLLVLSEDWCGDSINTLPLIAKMLESTPGIDMRIIGRDANLDLMDQHLTHRSRSIPAIILLDENYIERAWWGPRPAPLQAWVMETGLALPKDERYREVRTWYARDHGKTALAELLDLLETAGQRPVEV